MSFASLSLPAELPPSLRLELERLCAQLTEWQKQNHNDDGTHSDVVATGRLFEHGRTKAAGEWTDVVYNAANFTGAGAMTWTVQAQDQITYQYMLIGETMFVDAYIDTASIGGTPSAAVFIAIPLGLKAARTKADGTYLLDNGTPAPAYQRVSAGATQIEVGRVDGANFTASANTNYVRVSIYFKVVIKDVPA